jgi:hypothetical protein
MACRAALRKALLRTVAHGSVPAVLSRQQGMGDRRLATVGLFSGIGGIELGLGKAGHEALLMCEI